MKTLSICIALLGVSGLASARPVVIEETTTLTNPDPVAFAQFGRQVATNGEYALVLGARDDLVDSQGEPKIQRDALLYRRVSGRWQFQQVLRTAGEYFYDGYYYPNHFAMKGDLAVIELIGGTQTYRLGTAGWQPAGDLRLTTEDIE